MADKLMNIPINDTQIYPFFRLHLKVERFGHLTHYSSNQNSMKAPKVVESTNKKTLL